MNEHTYTHQVLPQSGGATDEELVGEIPTVGAGALAAGVAGAKNSGTTTLYVP
ncbi:hypothetical protein [Paraburkholderia antibiotica]|uniref:Uncharacterized protein n=1 Tax=Paraburkholderia antibiotica TaxID=2728839 RepID=A0A7X9X6L5_9BURK|nr:hypothetical protein [Paraburkholderia antibiotica]NML32390.1 hypothetical protein [Paraburkholderia antibiotica]